MITVPPQMRDAGVDEMAYRKVAQQCYARMMMARGQLNMFSQRFRLENGVEITCSYCWGKQDIYISLPVVPVEVRTKVTDVYTGFIMHPRSGDILLFSYFEYKRDENGIVYFDTLRTHYGVTGGWENGVTTLATTYLYPLVDPDNASFVLTRVSPKLSGNFARTNGNYGNLYWWAEGSQILSWKGTPTRYGEVLQAYYIPGISEQETIIPGVFDDLPEYTVFSSNLYKQGKVYKQAPVFSWPYTGETRSLILGAMQDSSGTTYIVTQNDHKQAPTYIWCFTDGGTVSGENDAVATNYLAVKTGVSITKKLTLTRPGYFVALWADKFSTGSAFRSGVWELLLEVSQTRVELPWFGNDLGTKIVCANGAEFSVSRSGSDSVSYAVSYAAAPVPQSGTLSETMESDSRTEVEYSITCADYIKLFEYKNNEKVTAVASLSFSATTRSTGGAWGTAVMSNPSCAPYSGFSHYVTAYSAKSYDSYGVYEYCYIPVIGNHTNDDITTLPHLPGNHDQQGCEISSGGACVGYDWLNQPMGRGTIKTIRSQGWLTPWVGDFPGQEHAVDTDFSISVCGVTIPMVKTTRRWKDEKQVYTNQVHHEAGQFFQNVSENCTVEKSTIHFLDQRYGVCLYKTVKDEITMECHLDDVSYIVAYGATQLYNVSAIKKDNYTATSTEKWHLIVNGVDTVVATATLDLLPFGEPRGDNVEYPGYVKLLSFPKPPGAAFGSPPDGTLLADLGCYEDGYDQVDGEQRQADGGMDHFYPEWCRNLEHDPFWADAAANRFWFTYPGEDMDPRGGMTYVPPEIAVEPIPIGSFARHHKLGDMYQFLIHQFNGNHQVITSKDINSFIDKRLPDGVATHDTTLYYPISLV